MTDSRSNTEPWGDDETLEMATPPSFTPGASYVMELVEVRKVNTTWEGNDRQLIAWDFEGTDDGGEPMTAGLLSSHATGLRSKARMIIGGLMGKAPEPGATVNPKALVGLSAAVTLEASDDGYPKATSVGPVPKA